MKLTIYKKGQGYYTRLCSTFTGIAISAIGCYRLKVSLETWLGNINGTTKQWLTVIIPLGVLIVLSFLVYLLVNKPKCADFMIETEGEMKKVNWPARKEIIASTKVVIFTVIALAVLIAVIDLSFHELFRFIGIITV